MTSVLRTSDTAARVAVERTSNVRPLIWLVLAAIVLRLLVFTTRGDYVAFDEGWYLLLGRNLYDGTGFRLSGLQHTTLSPLFPILSGLAALITRNAVWAGRIIAAIAAGLLLWPCWHIFRRIAAERVAWSACILMAVMPSLTPFAAPYWIGWDLWVGAEPILHLLLFSAIALTLRARERERPFDWILAGAAFGLAYLARPEALIVFGLIGLGIGSVAILRRTPRRIAHALLMALAFAVTAAPYWLYLHGAIGRWTLTGRVVELPARTAAGSARGASGSGNARTGALTGVEAMLWRNDDRQYVRELYGLNATGTRLRSTYWGIPEPVAAHGASQHLTTSRPGMDTRPPAAAPEATSDRGTMGPRVPDETARIDVSAAASTTAPAPRRPGRWELHARALGTVVPWFVWGLAGLGLFGRRAKLLDELLVVIPLIMTSIVIARVVGADPRTQLFMVPVALFYAARGIWLIADLADRQRAAVGLRRGFIPAAATGIVAIILSSTVVHWVWMGTTMGSPHHIIGAANHGIGEELRSIVPVGEAVMSWHPAVALFAERDWRVLPYASLPEIVRYANAIGCEYVVLSRFYPGSKLIEHLDRDHLVLRVPPGASADTREWWIDFGKDGGSRAVGLLRYSMAEAR